MNMGNLQPMNSFNQNEFLQNEVLDDNFENLMTVNLDTLAMNQSFYNNLIRLILSRSSSDTKNQLVTYQKQVFSALTFVIKELNNMNLLKIVV